jgi:hypothetical protein
VRAAKTRFLRMKFLLSAALVGARRFRRLPAREVTDIRAPVLESTGCLRLYELENAVIEMLTHTADVGNRYKPTLTPSTPQDSQSLCEDVQTLVRDPRTMPNRHRRVAT